MALGVAPGERVVLWASNVPEWVVLQFALAKIGAVLVTANTALRERDIDYLLRQSEAATLITIRACATWTTWTCLEAIGALAWRAAVAGACRLHRRRPAAWRDAVRGAGASGVAQSDDAALDERGRAVGIDDVINMQYTSGTTGLSQGRDAVEPQHREQRSRAGGALRVTASRSAVPAPCRCFTASAA